MTNIIELKNVNKWFDKFQALKDVSLEVNQQEKIVICGPSGSGKSTLIRCINRLEEHQEGQITVDGKEMSENTKDIEKITNLSTNIFWLVIPSLALFITLPIFLKKGFGFYLSLSLASFITVLCYYLMIVILGKFGIKL